MSARARPEREARIVVPAPAKLNLFLHVTGRRTDGYHLLESVFTAIDLHDRIRLQGREDGRVLRAADIEGVPEADDITLRAARLLKDACRVAQGVAIAVDKRIPIGGGLGGGSSDAASVLLALNRLWNLHLSRAELAALGLQLGADVPFFLGVGAAFVRGIGETLVPVSLPPRWIALVAPPEHVPTASVFAAPELTRSTPSARMGVFPEGHGRNDLQSVVAARYPVIASALKALEREQSGARMTGSGACVFAPCSSREGAESAVRAVVQAVPGARGFVVRPIARHPLASFA